MQIALVDTWRGARFPVTTDPNDDVFQVMRDLQAHVGGVQIAAHQVEYRVDSDETLQMIEAQARDKHVDLTPWAGYDFPVFENIPIKVG